MCGILNASPQECFEFSFYGPANPALRVPLDQMAESPAKRMIMFPTDSVRVPSHRLDEMLR